MKMLPGTALSSRQTIQSPTGDCRGWRLDVAKFPIKISVLSAISSRQAQNGWRLPGDWTFFNKFRGLRQSPGLKHLATGWRLELSCRFRCLRQSPVASPTPYKIWVRHPEGVTRTHKIWQARAPPVACSIDPATTASTAKHQAVVALHHKPISTEETQPMAVPTLPVRDSTATQIPGAIVALDLGTTTGWALVIGQAQVISGTLDLNPNRYDGGGMRYLRLRNWLEQLRLDSGGIEAIHYEEVRRHAGTSAAHVYGGLLATLTGWCEERGVAYQGVPVGTIKRFIAGKGNADKSAVITAVRERGYSPKDDNEADAIAILLWALATTGGVR